jgi:hypothetical protein
MDRVGAQRPASECIDLAALADLGNWNETSVPVVSS